MTAAPEDPHRCLLRFRYPDADSAATVADAVAVEQDEIDDDRSRASVARNGATVAVDVAARDLVALRAGLNTWSRLVDTAESSLDVARDEADVVGDVDDDQVGTGEANDDQVGTGEAGDHLPDDADDIADHDG